MIDDVLDLKYLHLGHTIHGFFDGWQTSMSMPSSYGTWKAGNLWKFAL